MRAGLKHDARCFQSAFLEVIKTLSFDPALFRKAVRKGLQEGKRFRFILIFKGFHHELLDFEGRSSALKSRMETPRLRVESMVADSS